MALGYWRGETVPFHRVWTTDSGNDATGTTVVLTLGGPLGAIIIPTVAGIDGPTITVDAEYAIPDDAGSVGLWSARWELAGTIVEAVEDIFYVKRSLTNANDPGSGLIGTPALQLLAALLTVDGAGSGLDADKLDGLDSTAFASTGSITTAIATHSAAVDPHADRAFATSAIATAIANLVNAAPGTLDTLNELALALGSDPNFATTMATALANKQPLDADLTAIAALTTTAYGRAFLALADAAAARTALALGTAATNATGDFQPIDSDLTSIAALTTTAYGRAFLALADAAAARTALALGTAATNATGDFQAADTELTALASTTSAANKLPYYTGSGTATTADLTAAGRAIIDDADASAQRTTLGLGTAATTAATDYATAAQGTTADNAIPKATLVTNGDMLTRAAGVPALITRANLAADAAFTAAFQAADAELAAIAGLTSAANKVPYFTGSGTAAVADFTAAGRALVDDADAAAQRTTLGLGTAATTAATDYLAVGSGLRRFSTGRYYTSDHYANDSTVTPTVGTLIVAPFPVGVTTAFDRITLEVTATFAAAEHRLGIYNDTGTGLPGTVLLDAGVIDTHTANGVISITINQTLTPGLYWLASVAQTAATSATVRGRTAIPSLYVGQSTGGNANVNGYSRTGVAGALPTFGAVSDYQSVQPKVMLRAT